MGLKVIKEKEMSFIGISAGTSLPKPQIQAR